MTKEQKLMALDLALKSLRDNKDEAADHLDVSDEVINNLLETLENELEGD